jgi:uncharacterized protein (TIGR03083 family)
MAQYDFLHSLSADAGRIAGIGSSAIDAWVPSCPEWHIVDLMKHVGGFHRYLTYLARLPDGEREGAEGGKGAIAAVAALGSDADVVSWFQEGADELVEALQAAPAGKTTRTFYGTHQPALLIRRAATETAVHRWDAEGAVDTPRPFDAPLAVAAIDEFLEVLQPLFFKYDDFRGTGETISLAPTDDDGGAWAISITADTTTWCRRAEQTEADGTVRGGVSDLYLFFLGRQAAGRLDVMGDTEMLTRWQAAIGF